MMIWKAYKYLFYQNYLWNSRGEWGWGKKAPQWAVNGMFFSFIMYFFAFGMFMSFVGFDYMNSFMENKIIYFGFLLVVIPSLHHYLFIYKDKYKKIIQEFQTNDPKKQKIGQIISWSYGIFSMICFFTAGALMHYSAVTGFTLLKYFGFK